MPTGSTKKKVLFTSHTANFQKFNQPYILMLRQKLKSPYKRLNFDETCEIHYASAGEEKIKNVDKSFKVDFCRNPFNLFGQVKAYRQLKKNINAGNYDLIHTHTPSGSVITRLAARKTRKKNGTKVIYTCHGFQFYEGGPASDWLLWYPVEKFMSRFCDLIVTINSEDYSLAKKHFKKTKVKQINGVGVDTTRFKPSLTTAKKTNLRKKLKLSDDDFIISYVAEFIPRKNHRMLLTAVQNLIKEHPDIHVLFIGQGILKERMEYLARSLRISKNIHFLGYRQDVPDLLEISDLYISTSKNEGLGLNVLEACLMDCPVVMTDNRGHSELTNAQAKFLVGIDDIDTLSDKIILAYRGAVRYKLKFPEKFALKQSLEKMRKIYQQYLK